LGALVPGALVACNALLEIDRGVFVATDADATSSTDGEPATDAPLPDAPGPVEGGPYIVFVTSMGLSPVFGGVDGGDHACNAVAADAGFGGRRFVALLAVAGGPSPFDRLGPGPYVTPRATVDGGFITVFAGHPRKDNLSCTPSASDSGVGDESEFGDESGTKVDLAVSTWTGADGTDCKAWTATNDDGGIVSGGYGSPVLCKYWYRGGTSNLNCRAALSLYCFEVR
jgi:hypothetical protein